MRRLQTAEFDEPAEAAQPSTAKRASKKASKFWRRALYTGAVLSSVLFIAAALLLRNVDIFNHFRHPVRQRIITDPFEAYLKSGVSWQEIFYTSTGIFDQFGYLANAVIYLPLGVALATSMLRHPVKQFFMIVGTALYLSVAFEAAQFYYLLGVSDITDVITAVIGALVGWIVYLLVRLLLGRELASKLCAWLVLVSCLALSAAYILT